MFNTVKITVEFTYQSACFVVVQVNCGARILAAFQRVYKLFGDFFPKRHVVAATPPNPSFTT